MVFEELRKKYPKFIYNGFKISKDRKKLKIIFDFEIPPDIKFSPKITLPNTIWNPQFSNLVFNLGLIEMISYWKATCSPEILVKAGSLDEVQIKWWEDLIKNGLGEFFYKNKFEFAIPKIISEGPKFKKLDKKVNKRNLILVGGGKDSALTLDSLPGKALLLNPTKAAQKIAGPSALVIMREIDPKLLDLNQKGYLNGHTPFSAYLAFLSTLAAHIYSYKNIVVSNEASSNEGNVEYKGITINHQYSKSLEFEEKFRDYSKKYLSRSTYYYSFLRDLNELEIARKFSSLEKYHNIFRSCNVGSRNNIWCNNCSKCLFAYIILYPFLGEKTKEIFGRDLLDDERLSPIMEELLQLPGKFKPFDCIGTKEEIEYAMLLGILKGPKKKLLEKYKDKIHILILGMGREGLVTRKLLQKNKINFGTTDANDGKDYLDKLEKYDVIIKSPGIPYLSEIKNAKYKGKIITSATSIFFDLFKGKIIGVTGTKGKSTTAALIYEVLKANGLDAYLAGNIGRPALELLEEINEDSIVVYEISSFQLADLTKSPNIAVITNIYEDHLDWHGSLKNYKKAKENIFKYQTKKDILIKNKNGIDAAKAVAKIFKIPNKKVEKAIKNFKSLPHRLEFVEKVRGIKFYNDSLATNPYATIFGLKILGDDVETLIAGGFDRGADYSILGPVVAKSKIKTLILFPDTGEKIWAAVQKANGHQEKIDAKSMKEAVKMAFEKTSKGKICLLSPASASFNMFKNYEDRGNQFKKWVLPTKSRKHQVPL